MYIRDFPDHMSKLIKQSSSSLQIEEVALILLCLLADFSFKQT